MEYQSNKQRGTTQSEYLLLITLIVIASLTAMSLFGEAVQQQTGNLAETIAGKPESSSASKQFIQASSSDSNPDNVESGGIISTVSSVDQGLFDGFNTQVDGFAQMVLHPIDTAQGIATLAYALVTDTAATLALLETEIGKDIGALTSGDPYEVARVVGNGVRNNSSVSSRHQRRRKEKICKA